MLGSCVKQRMATPSASLGQPYYCTNSSVTSISSVMPCSLFLVGSPKSYCCGGPPGPEDCECHCGRAGSHGVLARSIRTSPLRQESGRVGLATQGSSPVGLFALVTIALGCGSDGSATPGEPRTPGSASNARTEAKFMEGGEPLKSLPTRPVDSGAGFDPGLRGALAPQSPVADAKKP